MAVRRATPSSLTGVGSIMMKSMNSGTPASVALPDRSSAGMRMSTSMRTVSYSRGVKNCGVNPWAAEVA